MASLGIRQYRGLSLHLEGSLFGTKNIMHAKSGITMKMVYGILKSGEHITVLDLAGNEAGNNNWIYTTLHAKYILINEERYFATDNLAINSINFNLNCFGGFFSGYSDSIRLTFPEEKKVLFQYDEKESIEIIDNDMLNAYFFFNHRYSRSGQSGDH